MSMITCLAEKSYNVQIPTKHCKPCRSFSGSQTNEGSNECPPILRLLRNDTFDIVVQLRPLLGNIKDDINAETKLMGRVLGADVKYKLYRIPDLEDIENTSISKCLRAKTKVEEIIHYSYGKTTMLMAYLNLYKDMLKGQADLEATVIHETRIEDIYDNLSKLSCKLNDLTCSLGIRKIQKKRLCKYIEAKKFSDLGHERDYILSILQIVQNNFDAIVRDIMGLDSTSITESCYYACVNKKITIRCRESRKELRSGVVRKRKRNKNKKNKNKRKNRERKRRCRKQKNSNKRTRRHCKKDKKRNKNKSQK